MLNLQSQAIDRGEQFIWLIFFLPEFRRSPDHLYRPWIQQLQLNQSILVLLVHHAENKTNYSSSNDRTCINSTMCVTTYIYYCIYLLHRAFLSDPSFLAVQLDLDFQVHLFTSIEETVSLDTFV